MRTLIQFPLQHVDDLVLVLLVDALKVFLVVDQVLLIDDPAVDLQDRLQLGQALLEQSLHGGGVDLPVEEGSVFPRKGDPFFPARTVLLEQEDDGLEDAAMEDSD